MYKYSLILFFLFIVNPYLYSQSPDGYKEAEQKLKDIKQTSTLEGMNNALAYINDQLDFTLIEDTPLWKEYIQYWVGFYTLLSDSPGHFAEIFVPDAKKVIDRTNPVKPQTASHLVSDLIAFFDQYALDNAAASLAAYAEYGIDVDANEQNEIAFRVLTASKLEQGLETPPALIGLEDQNKANVLLIFYENGCGNCNWQMDKLTLEYDLLKQKNIRVISVSADFTEDSFQARAKDFPWTDKLCDYEGMDGPNFINYGVISTPTIFLFNDKGEITGKYGRLDETGLFD
ncbi:MAG: thioredoxin family protein [Bacteroidales bacterium]|nr:thioredoxin family protein [Bacteroidales bacterium]